MTLPFFLLELPDDPNSLHMLGNWGVKTVNSSRFQYFLKVSLEASAGYHHLWLWASTWTVQVNSCNKQGTNNILKFCGRELLRPLKFLEVPYGKCRANPLAELGWTQAW